MKQRPIIIELVGFSALVMVFLLYNYLERARGGVVAVFVAVALMIPIAFLWRRYRKKYRA